MSKQSTDPGEHNLFFTYTKTMSKHRLINDPAPGMGSFEGDLKYGRAHGTNNEKGKDFAADRQNGVATNLPVMPLRLVQPRDPEIWRRDLRVSEARKNLDNSQHGVNYLIQCFQSNLNDMRSNLKLKIGKQRF